MKGEAIPLKLTIFLEELFLRKKAIAVIGLGYVGLPLALEFSKFFKVIAFDIDDKKIQSLRQHIDPSNEISPSEFLNSDIVYTSDREKLSAASFYIISVPTEVDEFKSPNLSHLKTASSTVAQVIKPGDFVVYESTVYPGCTEEVCIPIIEQISGLTAKLNSENFVTSIQNPSFFFGYSPERINPGDKKRKLKDIIKIVSSGDSEGLEVIAHVYGYIIKAGVYKAPSIKVAEAAKIVENTQRDLNISLMNELAMIFDKLDIDTREVIDAASTKWNFHTYYPGLVGGHCISVDPYYLIYKAREIGIEPQVIAAGRHVNDEMPQVIAKKLIQILSEVGKNIKSCKILVLGITFKENVSDVRNSKIINLVNSLKALSLQVEIFDPYAIKETLMELYQIKLIDSIKSGYDAVIAAVGHDIFLHFDLQYFLSIMNEHPILIDVKGAYPKELEGIKVWRL